MPHEGASGFHLYPDLGIIELINPKTGEIEPDGTPGEIVFTALDARGTMVLRYRIGDIAEGGITWDIMRRDCGRHCPRLIGPIARVSECAARTWTSSKALLVDFNMLEHLLDDQRGVAAWQIELRKRNDDPLECDEVLLHVTPDDAVSESTFARARPEPALPGSVTELELLTLSTSTLSRKCAACSGWAGCSSGRKAGGPPPRRWARPAERLLPPLVVFTAVVCEVISRGVHFPSRGASP